MHIKNAEEDAHLDRLAPDHFGLVDLFDQHHFAIAHRRDFIRRRGERPGRNPEEPQHEAEQPHEGDPQAPVQPGWDAGNEMDQHRQQNQQHEKDEDDTVARRMDVHGV